MVGHVKDFGKINCLSQSAGWWTRLIKVLSYSICKRLEGSYGGVVGTEAMLVG